MNTPEEKLGKKFNTIIGVLNFFSVLVVMYYSANYGFNVLSKEVIPLIAEGVLAISTAFYMFIIQQALMSVSGGPILVFILYAIIGPISLMGAFNIEKHVSEMFLFLIGPLMIIGIFSIVVDIFMIIAIPFALIGKLVKGVSQCTADVAFKAAKEMGANDDTATTVGAVVGVATGAAIGLEVGSVVRDGINSVDSVDDYTNTSDMASAYGSTVASIQPDTSMTEMSNVMDTSNIQDMTSVSGDINSSAGGDSAVNFTDAMSQPDGTAVVHSDGSVDLTDANMQYVGHITSGGQILNSLNLLDGRIDGTTIFDAQGQLAYTIEGDAIYDNMHQIAYTIREGNIFDKMNQLVGRIS